MHNIKHCKEKQNIICRNTTKYKLKKKKKSYNRKSKNIYTLIKYIWSPQIYREKTFWLIKFEDELQGVVDSHYVLVSVCL
jgi:5-methylcytosine-specific restriction endonuclease McrBC regulatory subunit McrC